MVCPININAEIIKIFTVEYNFIILYTAHIHQYKIIDLNQNSLYLYSPIINLNYH